MEESGPTEIPTLEIPKPPENKPKIIVAFSGQHSTNLEIELQYVDVAQIELAASFLKRHAEQQYDLARANAQSRQLVPVHGNIPRV